MRANEHLESINYLCSNIKTSITIPFSEISNGSVVSMRFLYQVINKLQDIILNETTMQRLCLQLSSRYLTTFNSTGRLRRWWYLRPCELLELLDELLHHGLVVQRRDTRGGRLEPAHRLPRLARELLERLLRALAPGRRRRLRPAPLRGLGVWQARPQPQHRRLGTRSRRRRGGLAAAAAQGDRLRVSDSLEHLAEAAIDSEEKDQRPHLLGAAEAERSRLVKSSSALSRS